ncbi:rCG23154 [Rattus norvegicus]|uniref:RCG23154 n=1 Tax=Rattus norvegicus TaxID=10116 RepID=A6KGA2_RAT|nr:rCG23154 [Rattus norvegicus]
MAAKVFESIRKFLLALALAVGMVNSALYNVDAGQRAVIFDRWHGVQDLVGGKGLIFSSLGYRRQLTLTASLDHGMYRSSLVAKTCRMSASHCSFFSCWWSASFLVSTPALERTLMSRYCHLSTQRSSS